MISKLVVKDYKVYTCAPYKREGREYERTATQVWVPSCLMASVSISYTLQLHSVMRSDCGAQFFLGGLHFHS
jgi:hypothetical protein